jgi:glucose/arabinose dehydrogenase
MKSKILPILFFIVSLISYATINAQPQINYQTLIQGLTAPVDIANAGDGSNRLFIVQQNGIIRIWNGSALLPAPFLNVGNIISTTGGEQGLLSLAFHHDYKNNGYFFIYYTNISGDITVAQYHVSVNPDIADTTGKVLLNISKKFKNHNGGKLNFGTDGNLYFATGDGGSGNDPDNNSQTGTSLLGKMIRINVDNFTVSPYYTIPTDNPYVGNASFDSKVWALGLRNPFRWSFDRLTGDIWIGDVGQSAKEEIDFRPADSTGHINYGWRCFEGSISTPGVPDCTPADYMPPIFDYDNPVDSSAAVVGGYVYRGNEYPAFTGYYIATDVYSGTIYLIKRDEQGNQTITIQTGLQNFIVSFGEGENSALYAISQSTNTLYKVTATVALPLTLTAFTVKRFNYYNEIKWTTETPGDIKMFYVEYSQDGIRFERAGAVAAGKNREGSSYEYHHVTQATSAWYRLAIKDNDGSISYSYIIHLTATENKTAKIYPTIIQNHLFNISLPEPAIKMQIISGNGKVVFERSLQNISGTITVALPPLAKGLYFVNIISTDCTKKDKIFIE